MNERVQLFLEGDLLERYLMGTTSPIESQEVEHYIQKYPKVKETYNELQENLEEYASSYAVTAPVGLKEDILKQLRKQPRNSFSLLAMVGCVAAALFGIMTFMIFKQNQELLEDRRITTTLIEQLNNDIVSNKVSLQSVEEQFMILNNAATEKYVLRGNNNARKLETVAYVNSVEKKSYVNVVTLPELAEEQVYQMWAEVDGDLVPLDILKVTKDNLVEIPYEEKMASLNITIEPKGGSKETSPENVVANIKFEN